MINIFKTKKAIYIASGIILAILIALLIIFLIIKGAKRNVNNPDVSNDQSSVMINSSSDLQNESTSVPKDNGVKLIITTPTSTKYTTTENTVDFVGSSDPEQPLLFNDKPVERNEQGYFNFTNNLVIGKNTFTFTHKGETKVYNITYRYVVINGYDPSTAKKYNSGSSFIVNLSARRESKAYATFNGKTISLTEETDFVTAENVCGSTFVNYTGIFTLPENNNKDISLGKISFSATYDGKSETFYSGNIVCKKSEIIVNFDPNAPSLGGQYLNVGTGYIAEVVKYNAETFDGAGFNSVDFDYSRPTNNYLPKGTVDYCSPKFLEYQSGSYKNTYVTMRCGKRVYLKQEKSGDTNIITNCYQGTLPDHNEITLNTFNQEGQHTVFNFGVLFKAPFYLDVYPQQYNNPSKQDYTIRGATFNYLDITFCYTTQFTGEITIPEDNPLFSSAQVIKNKSDYTLRLFLKKQGGFYGWDSYYNDKGELCFEFLNPKKITQSENPYGVDLPGAIILIDVGHGGKDPGAPGFDITHHSEAIQNLNLANKIKSELNSIGATVYLTRDDDTYRSSEDKITMIKRIKPDYVIAIHHNSSSKESPNGFSSYYFNPFSMKASELIYQSTASNNIYKSSSLLWHYYYTLRTTNCPTVLTENGFMSNKFDYDNIINDTINNKKAKSITLGIINYFKSIQ